jgi:hypothetical protein
VRLPAFGSGNLTEARLSAYRFPLERPQLTRPPDPSTRYHALSCSALDLQTTLATSLFSNTQLLSLIFSMASASVISTLISSLPGITVLTPSSPSYPERRKIRCQDELLEKIEPPAIAVPKSAEDVASVVRWCVTNGVRFTVRGGGNDYFGTSLS